MLKKIMSNPGLPNYITIARLLAIPVILILLSLKYVGPWISAISAIIFLLAALTDLLDGHLARKYGHESNLGRFLDPLADKLLVMSALIMMIPLNRVPAWLVFLIIAREIIITGLRAIASDQGLVISASSKGKQKTLSQNIAIFCLLWSYPLLWARLDVVGTVILYLSLILSYTSAYSYFSAFFKARKKLTMSDINNEAKKNDLIFSSEHIKHEDGTNKLG